MSRYKREWSGACESAGWVTFAMVSFADADGNMHECKPSRSVRRRPIGLAVPMVHLSDSPSPTARLNQRSDRRPHTREILDSPRAGRGSPIG